MIVFPNSLFCLQLFSQAFIPSLHDTFMRSRKTTAPAVYRLRSVGSCYFPRHFFNTNFVLWNCQMALKLMACIHKKCFMFSVAISLLPNSNAANWCFISIPSFLFRLSQLNISPSSIMLYGFSRIHKYDTCYRSCWSCCWDRNKPWLIQLIQHASCIAYWLINITMYWRSVYWLISCSWYNVFFDWYSR